MPTILIVDDVRTEQEIIKKALQPLGYSFLIAENGTQALEVAAKEVPALIVLDVIMPDMDGFKACRKLKKADGTKNIPIILCTTKGGESDKFWGEKQGADAYVTKPFDAGEFLGVARRLL
ncbi:MAG: two-component system response regulator [Acidobacteria bacterium]|nr:MAG: two-component system response regulator [Acidobacteriota bacterium]RLE36444.1 MAG: two-component system response regulator [Acidobacteriota bacterium]